MAEYRKKNRYGLYFIVKLCLSTTNKIYDDDDDVISGDIRVPDGVM